MIDQKQENRLLYDKDYRQENKTRKITPTHTCIISTCILLGITLIILGFTIHNLVENTVQKKIQEKVVMTQENIGLWGAIPGDAQIDVYRKATFYEFQNPFDFVFRGKKPIFLERNGYELLMKQEFLDPVFEQGNVKFNRWTYYQESDNQKIDKVKVLNPGAIGIWNVVKNYKPYEIASATFGAVVQNVVEQDQNINSCQDMIRLRLIKNKDIYIQKTLFRSINNETKKQQMWSDSLMGLGNSNTTEFWIRAANEGHDYGIASSYLKDYFVLTQYQIADINSQMRVIVKGINDTVYPYYGCNQDGEIKFKYQCDGHYLTSLQYANQEVSLNPPPGLGVPKQKSVKDFNRTLHDYIELNYFYMDYFLVNITNEPEYQNLIFDLDWMYHLIDRNYDYPTTPQFTFWDILIHSGNMKYIYEIGENFDKSEDINIFQELTNRFNTSSNYHSRVLWEWIKQLATNFSYRKNIGGSQELLAFSLFGSQSIYWRFQNLTEYLYPELISSMVMVDQNWADCKDMLTSSIEDLTDQQIKNICTMKQVFISKETILFIIRLCKSIHSDEWEEFRVRSELDAFQLIQMCEVGATDRSFQTLIDTNDALLKQQYNCNFEKCSQIELAIKQWARTEITLNPPQKLIKQYQQVTSVHYWNPIKFKKGFEYQYFVNEFSDLFIQKPKLVTDEHAKYLLNFQGIFNTLSITTAFAYHKSDMKQEFQEYFGFDNYDDLLHYFRYMTVEISLGGITVEKTPKELLFGYFDENLDFLTKQDPATGGDPAKSPWIILGDTNMTKNDAILFNTTVQTGSSNIDDTRKFVNYQGSTSPIFNYTEFNGNNTKKFWGNPWEKQEFFQQGTDGLLNPPFQTKNKNLQIYVPQIYRTLQFKPSDGPDKFGLNTLRFNINVYSSQLQEDSNYYSEYSGIFNLTKVYSAPVIVSLPHFLYADPKLSQLIEFQDQNGNKVQANQYDQSYQLVEPNSGVPLEAVIQVQINMEIKQDNLFFSYPDCLIPITKLWNSGNFTQDSANAQFGELRSGLKLNKLAKIICLAIGSFFVLLAIIIFMFLYFRKSSPKKEKLYDASLQPVTNQSDLLID